MKRLFLSICIFFIPLTCWSETYFVTGTVQSVEPVYTNSNLIVPERRCRNIKVPVYGQVASNSGASGADVLGGMVVGALIGKALTNDNNAAGVGAVMGGVVAAEQNKKTPSGTRTLAGDSTGDNIHIEAVSKSSGPNRLSSQLTQMTHQHDLCVEKLATSSAR